MGLLNCIQSHRILTIEWRWIKPTILFQMSLCEWLRFDVLCIWDFSVFSNLQSNKDAPFDSNTCGYIIIYNIIQLYLNSRYPNDLYICRSTPQNKAFSNQKKGHLGSRFIYLCFRHVLGRWASTDGFTCKNPTVLYLFVFGGKGGGVTLGGTSQIAFATSPFQILSLHSFQSIFAERESRCHRNSAPKKGWGSYGLCLGKKQRDRIESSMGQTIGERWVSKW